ncbi:NAD(P)-dependent oxidoreductase [Streptomyces sp. 796.1]|uniref:NAD(P)-dependent oxidoreductase n=1 Tax=Streptomyces sp. 796.1 TaxID=3163029 RepID=UPI0039C94D6B
MGASVASGAGAGAGAGARTGADAVAGSPAAAGPGAAVKDGGTGPDPAGRSVTVLGLGPMGRAMARAFLARGYAVTVWNRTAHKADDLVAAGARRAGSVREALAANALVVLSLTDRAAMYALLEPAVAALPGRVLANLSSDTPDGARAAAAWAERHGAGYLAAGIAASPPQVGTDQGRAYYSGPAELFEAHRGALGVISPVEHLGADPGLAPLCYQVQMDLFWTGLTGWLHAVTMAEAHGVGAAEVLPYVLDVAGSLPEVLRFYSARLAAGDDTGDVDRIAMGAASAAHVAQTARAAGVDPTLPDAVLATFQRGLAAGHGDRSFTALREALRAAPARA